MTESRLPVGPAPAKPLRAREVPKHPDGGVCKDYFSPRLKLPPRLRIHSRDADVREIMRVSSGGKAQERRLRPSHYCQAALDGSYAQRHRHVAFATA
jgi:hypothetical protein